MSATMTGPLVVTLSKPEIVHAGTIGVMRRVSSMSRGGQPKYDQDSVSNWQADVEGAGAELAVAKLTGLYWNAIVEKERLRGLPDVGPYHVRWTWRRNGCLILHEDDPDAPFVLVTGEAPTYTVQGVLESPLGTVERYWRTNVPIPAFFVPQSDLGPFEP